jgi:hypothetical protein
MTKSRGTARQSTSRPANAPADATGQCKDGSYTTAASRHGACAGHKGVKAWFK